MKNRFYFWLPVFVVLCLAGWTVNAQLQKSGSARQAWEYKSMVFAIDGFGRQTLYEDGKQVPGSVVPITRAPELGAQGWELVSVAATDRTISGGSVATFTYWFIRPK